MSDRNREEPVVLEALDLAEIAVHPTNPRSDLGDLDELTASIKRFGVIQPVRVFPAARFLELFPEHRDAVGDRRYVLQTGEPRLAAARAAGRTLVAVVVVPPMEPTADLAVQLHENLHRLELDPLDEARKYAAFSVEGKSLRQVAALLGVGRVRVQRRLKLLNLTTAAQVALAAGELSRKDAEQLSDLPAELAHQAWHLREEQPWLSVHEAIAAVTEQPASQPAAGVPGAGPSVDAGPNVASEAGQPATAALTNGAQRDPDRSPVVSAGMPTSPPRGTLTGPTVAEICAEERAAADRARMKACASLVRRGAQPSGACRDLGAACQEDGWLNVGRCLRMAHRWLHTEIATGKHNGVAPTDAHEWRRLIRQRNRDHLRWLTWSMGITAVAIRAQTLPWQSDVVVLLDTLIASEGYELAEWERVELEAARHR